tara:strand:+ start:1297 stop:1971 length:675 start_codon:yes stop_codon:yes gene_type:complete
MKKEIVKKSVGYMLINFSINLGYDKSDAEDKLNAYCALLTSRLTKNGVTEDMFQDAVGRFVDKTSGSNYNKLPSVGDLLDVLGMKPKDLEDIAKQQAELVFSSLNKMAYMPMVMFSDPVTNYTVKNSMGGLSKFVWDYSPQNQQAKEHVWGKREFVSSYITNSELENLQYEPVCLSTASKGDKILNIGDVEQCGANLVTARDKLLQLASPKNEDLKKITDIYKK